MTGLLVFLPLPLLTVIAAVRWPALGWRGAAVYAALAWGTLIAVLTEGLSAFSALRFGPALALWLVVATGLGICVWRGVRRSIWPTPPNIGGLTVGAMAAGLVALLGLTLVTALGAAPNTPDVLSYHLPRQLIWLQQGGVSHFDTSDARALMMPPWTEMAQAQAMLLAGGDRWAALPQWLAYGLGMIATSLLARECGAGRAGQWLAAWAFATLPMACLQASSAKNDLMVAAWLTVLAWLVLRAAPAGPGRWAAIGAALGLALATKTTAWIYAAPLLILLVRPLVRERRGGLVILGAVLVIAGPHWVRNQAWFGTPLGVHRAEAGGAQGNEDFSWRAVVSIAARNTALHFASPWAAGNAAVEAGVGRMHAALGRDVRDPRTTLLGMEFSLPWRPRNETTAGAPVQLGLGLCALLAGLALGRGRGATGRLPLLLAGAGLLLACVLLKWQPWGTRLHLPAFALLAVGIAVWAERIGPRVIGACALLCGLGVLPSLEPDIRPVWSPTSIFTTSRWQDYFTTHPQDRAPAEAALGLLAAQKVERLHVVNKHGFPYALMRGFLDVGEGSRRLVVTRHGRVETVPQAVVVVNRLGDGAPLYRRFPGSAERFRAVGATDPFRVFLPEARARALAERLPPPAFAGWERSDALERDVVAQSAGGPVTVRRMSGPELRLEFRREALRMTLRLVAANPTARACELEIQLDGARVARVRLDPGVGWQAVAVPLAPAGEQGVLTLFAPAEVRPVFRALQIFDD